MVVTSVEGRFFGQAQERSSVEIRSGPERVLNRWSWAAFTPICLRGRDKGQCETFGWSTVEGRAAYCEGCLQLERNEARTVRKFLEGQISVMLVKVQEGQRGRPANLNLTKCPKGRP
jgi:hypothetical protein